MHLSTTPGGMPGGGSVTDYAIVHNGALIARDVTLRIGIPPAFRRYLRTVSVRTTGAEERQVAGAGQTLVLRGLQPGENRWVAITVATADLPAGASAYAIADDMVGNVAVNGFGAGVRAVSLAAAIQDSLAAYRGVAMRLAGGFGAKASASDVALTLDLSPDDYVAFVHDRVVSHLKSDLAQLGAFDGGDRFGLAASLSIAAERRTAPRTGRRRRDPVKWRWRLLDDGAAAGGRSGRHSPNGALAEAAVSVRPQACPDGLRVEAGQCLSSAFLTVRESRRLTNAVYPKLLLEVAGCLREAAGSQGELKGESLAALEKQHRTYLLALSKPRG